MTFTDITDIAVSGIAAQRLRMATTASNLANANSTRSEEGGPYRRRDPVFEAEPLKSGFEDRLGSHVRSVRVGRVQTDSRPPLVRYEPGHPDADADGYVELPNVNPIEELTNMMLAMRSYEANLLIMRKVREMANAAMQLGR